MRVCTFIFPLNLKFPLPILPAAQPVQQWSSSLGSVFNLVRWLHQLAFCQLLHEVFPQLCRLQVCNVWDIIKHGDWHSGPRLRLVSPPVVLHHNVPLVSNPNHFKHKAVRPSVVRAGFLTYQQSVVAEVSEWWSVDLSLFTRLLQPLVPNTKCARNWKSIWSATTNTWA